MNHIGVVIAGLLGGALGFAVSVILAIWIAQAKGVSAREGAHGYLGFVAGVGGGLITLIVSMLLTLRYQGVTNVIPLFTGTLAGVFTVLVISLCALGIFWYSVPKLLNRNGPSPQLIFEIALPAALANELSLIKASLSCNSHERPVVYLDPEISRTEDGNRALSGRVELYYQANWRLLALELPGERSLLFQLSLPADPTLASQYRRWSQWKRPNQTVLSGKAPSKVANAEVEAFSIRYRIEFWLEPRE